MIYSENIKRGDILKSKIIARRKYMVLETKPGQKYVTLELYCFNNGETRTMHFETNATINRFFHNLS